MVPVLLLIIVLLIIICVTHQLSLIEPATSMTDWSLSVLTAFTFGHHPIHVIAFSSYGFQVAQILPCLWSQLVVELVRLARKDAASLQLGRGG
jgi:hypothetical protein